VTVDRRFLLAGAFALAASPAQAAEAEAFDYKGFRYEIDPAVSPLPTDTVRSLQAQVDIVAGLAIKPDIAAFFRSVPGRLVTRTQGGPGAYSFDLKRMLLSTAPDPPQNPVLLHELLHAYHDQRLGRDNPRLTGFYEACRARGGFPPEAYMFKNRAEFFAMTASVVLWGKAARPPYARERVRTLYPELYAWIVDEFGWRPG